MKRIDWKRTVGKIITDAFESNGRGEDIVFVFGNTQEYARITLDSGHDGEDCSMDDGREFPLIAAVNNSALIAHGIFTEEQVAGLKKKAADDMERQRLKRIADQRQEYLKLRALYEPQNTAEVPLVELKEDK